MNFSNKLGLSLFVFLAFDSQKVCFAPARTRKPSPILTNKSKSHPRGYDKLDDFLEPEKRGTKEPVNQYPWIGHLLALGLDPEAVVRRSAIYDEISALEASPRTELEAEEFENRRAIERELILLKIPQIEANRRKAILTFEQRELAAIKETMQEEKIQILRQIHEATKDSLEEKLKNLDSIFNDGKAMTEKYYLDMATLQKQKDINDFYRHNTEFCEQHPNKFEQHKRNLIQSTFLLMKPQLEGEIKQLELWVNSERAKLRQEQFARRCQEFGLTTLT